MVATQPTSTRDRRVTHLASAGWLLAAGGVVFFIGGGMHPHDDPPDVTLDEHLSAMFANPGWYRAHAVLLTGMGLMTAGLLQLARRRAFDGVARGPRIATIAAVTGVLGTLGAAVHLFMKVEADELAAGASTPIIDLNNLYETLTVPAFGLAVAALAVVGGRSRVLGPPALAVFGVIGGVGYALAGATFLFTDALDPLFPAAGAIGVWGAAVGITLALRSRADRTRPPSSGPGRFGELAS